MKNDRQTVERGHPMDFFVLRVPRFGLSWTAVSSSGSAVAIATGYVTTPTQIWALVALGVVGLLRDVAIAVIAIREQAPR
ncbi:hypothetical protein OG453_07135 [Streptomyces sp. NBC_01381]|uniref:hypothetical protein n=1 Tax=Streptomyces sp. NBC_01381 TaxID=2903845 RepID=UPI0022536E39|nr:hypothetical protein [Streptomyces sp. NBC_01381]MCX4666442.1 hypothetical protein [Streptomyces sp. NBC_01381]